MTSSPVQQVSEDAPASAAATRLAIRVLDPATPVSTAMELVSAHYLASPQVDIVVAALQTFAPDDETGWVRLGGRAWVREWVRPESGCAIVPMPGSGPDAALTMPWVSVQTRQAVLTLPDIELLPREADQDRREVAACGVRAMIACAQTSDGLLYGSVSVARAQPGPWPETHVADLRLLNAALTSRMVAEQARRSLGDAIAVAEQARSTQQQLFAALGHELRTPLAAILGYAELLDEESAATMPPVLATQVRRTSDVIIRAGEQLLAVVEDLLETGRNLGLERERETVEVAAAVRDVLHWHQATARAAGVRIDSKVPPGIAVCTRPSGFRQALTNLIGNAIVHNRHGGTVSIEVQRLTGEGTQPRVRVIVRDTAPGLTASQLESIFNPFVRFAEHDATGTGLGLPLARAVIERDGGTVDAESRVGAGSTFWIELPEA